MTQAQVQAQTLRKALEVLLPILLEGYKARAAIGCNDYPTMHELTKTLGTAYLSDLTINGAKALNLYPTPQELGAGLGIYCICGAKISYKSFGLVTHCKKCQGKYASIPSPSGCASWDYVLEDVTRLAAFYLKLLGVQDVAPIRAQLDLILVKYLAAAKEAKGRTRAEII